MRRPEEHLSLDLIVEMAISGMGLDESSQSAFKHLEVCDDCNNIYCNLDVNIEWIELDGENEEEVE